MRKDYEDEVDSLTDQVKALTLTIQKLSDEKEYSSQRSGEEL